MDNAAVALKSKHSLLPVLVVLFIVSYGLMALLVVEQARTIDTQRSLIRTLFSDSTELTALKGKAVQKRNAEAQAQAQAQANSQAQAPSSQAAPQDGSRNKNNKNDASKLRRRTLQKPPRPASDLDDERRAVISI